MTARVSTHEAREDARNAAIRIHVNGELVPREKAVVSVYDSAFLLGDGVWTGLRLHRGHIPFLEQHLDRLFEHARAIDLDIGKTREELTAAIQATLAANGMHDGVHIRVMVTRGRKRRPFQHPGLSDSGPTIVIIAEHSRPSDDILRRGVRLHTVPHHRSLPLTQDAKLNTHSKLNCILALNHALRAGADEALMLDPFGFVNTTNSCNFFIVRDGEVWTSTGDYCMNGITRKKVINLCRENRIPVRERNFTLLDAYSAEEAFLTGTFGAQTPVFEIDGRVIGGGRPGPVLLRIRRLYQRLIAAEASSSAR